MKKISLVIVSVTTLLLLSSYLPVNKPAEPKIDYSKPIHTVTFDPVWPPGH
ncbi:hypothetical protein [Bacillus sp. B1-b2]|uniref:hypothetical protein n=1 Tax=Bacillus sp. B1-b2 TaxID=2653201 RepID=UPI001869DAAB|nr:hypothetical protein [Bacillus sp. B1-b2]